MILLAVAIIIFLGLHSIRIFAPNWRQDIINRLGTNAWRGVYSVLSIASLVFLIYAFVWSKNDFQILYTPPIFMIHITLTLMLIAMILLMASVFPAGKISVWVKHPLVLSVKVWAFAHLLANGTSNAVMLFAAFLIWGVLVRISLKRRQRAGEVVVRSFVSAKYDVAAVVTGVVLYVAIVFYLHQHLIGVSPLAAAGM
jgi:uncharacterized membrane protein